VDTLRENSGDGPAKSNFFGIVKDVFVVVGLAPTRFTGVPGDRKDRPYKKNRHILHFWPEGTFY